MLIDSNTHTHTRTMLSAVAHLLRANVQLNNLAAHPRYLCECFVLRFTCHKDFSMASCHANRYGRKTLVDCPISTKVRVVVYYSSSVMSLAGCDWLTNALHWARGSVPFILPGMVLYLSLLASSPERPIQEMTIQEKRGQPVRRGSRIEKHQCTPFRVAVCEEGFGPNQPPSPLFTPQLL